MNRLNIVTYQKWFQVESISVRCRGFPGSDDYAAKEGQFLECCADERGYYIRYRDVKDPISVLAELYDYPRATVVLFHVTPFRTVPSK